MPEMDRQHRRLVDLVNQLHDAMKSGQGATQVDTVLNGLAAYTRTHFQDEENLLRQRGWSGLPGHLQLHQGLLRQLAGFVEAHKAGKRISTLDLSAFLKDWLTKHILQEDRQYGKALAG